MTTEGVAPEVTQPGAVRIRRALLTVSDKRGIVDFARGLAELGVEIVSTGGTARELQDAGIEVRSIEDFTGFPEIMGGRGGRPRELRRGPRRVARLRGPPLDADPREPGRGGIRLHRSVRHRDLP